MMNINLGKNRELMEKCRPLYEYSWLVNEMRKGLTQKLPVEEAAERAIKTCVEEGIMVDFLAKHRAEVIDVILTEYDEQAHMEMEREEWLAIGEEKGRAESILELLEDLGEVPAALRETVMAQTELEVLKKWHKAAARAASLEEFQEQM